MSTIYKYTTRNRERVTQAQREENNQQWYKDKAKLIGSTGYGSGLLGYGGVSDYKRMKVNYDLFNNIVNMSDFEYVCKPYGAETGDLPANMTNRDIVSGKIKVLLGMEMKMPFSWNVIATNEQATTRREEEEFGRIKQFVISEIMKPIEQAAQQQAMAQYQGQEITPEQAQQIQEQVAQQVEAQTPDEVRQYMAREHQDPAEVMMVQILNYLIQKEKIPEKFNKGWKHSNLAGREIYHIGIFNGEPCLTVVNPLYFEYDVSPDLDYINEGEWARCEYRMTPSQVVSLFGSELTDEEIDRIYDYQENPSSPENVQFTFDTDGEDNSGTLTVVHVTWKSLRKIGFLEYIDPNGEEQLQIVDETYRLNKQAGDIRITWEWIPEAHECWQILDDIFCYCRPVPGQHKDLDNLYKCNLPYYGASVDNLNSPVTSPMDRMKSYQYYYNIILYRIELLMASDKGKVLAANINAIPKSSGLDIQKFMYFLEANKIAFFNPNEEGNKTAADVTNLVKEIDMSLASDIAKYMQMAEFIQQRCGATIGVTDAMEGAIGPNDAVSNTRQSLVQSSHIIQPYFELHNNVKREVLQGLIDTAVVAYSESQPKKLSYIMDDMTVAMFTTDPEMLPANSYGIFVSNSSKAEDAKLAVTNLAQAALQNQQADLTDIIKVIRSESIQEAEELLEAAQSRKAAQMQEQSRAALEDQRKARQEQAIENERAFQREKELIVLKETEKRKTDIQRQLIESTGFDQNKDEDEDGVPDVLEVAKFGVDAEIKKSKLALDRDKLDHQKAQDAAKNKLEEEKLKIQKQKGSSSK